MKPVLLLITMLFSVKNNEPYKIEFGTTSDKTNNWYILSDNVMGGLSNATINYGAGSVTINGEVSLQNNGGFVSIKSPFGRYNLTKYSVLKIKLKTSAQKYAFSLENSRRWYEPAYKMDLIAKEVNVWETISLNLKDFEEEIIGRPTGNKITDDILKNIIRLGIATNEKREGAFTLEIGSIEFL